jgi:hypothetical protein
MSKMIEALQTLKDECVQHEVCDDCILHDGCGWCLIDAWSIPPETWPIEEVRKMEHE